MWARILIISVILASALGVMIWQDLAPTGFVVYEKTGPIMTPHISQFYPEGRLTEAVNFDSDSYQLLVGEPVYFDVRLPRILETVKVQIKTQGDVDMMQVGLRQPPNNEQAWRYLLKQPEIKSFDHYSVVEQTFDLKDSYVEKGQIRFLLTRPDDAEIYVGEVTVQIEGNKLILSDFTNAIKRRL